MGEREVDNGMQEFACVFDSINEKLNAELAKNNGNNWLDCLGTRIFVIETYAYSRSIKEKISAEKFDSFAQKLEAIKDEYSLAKDKDCELTDQEKESFITRLTALKETIF